MNQEKTDKLRSVLSDIGSAVVAFSGGVDSSVLLAVAHQVLGKPNCLAVFLKSSFSTEREYDEALRFCAECGFDLMVWQIDVLEVFGVRENPPNRCYLCKQNMLRELEHIAMQKGFNAVIEGSNLDDLDDYRPGRQALLESRMTRSPLLEAGFTKADIRELAHVLGLRQADKPSNACLATRFRTGHHYTCNNLARVEKCEDLLHDMGFELVRVRVEPDWQKPAGGDWRDDFRGTADSGEKARVELGEQDLARLADLGLRQAVIDALLAEGYLTAEIDEQGYRRGSMNRAASNLGV